MSRVLTALLFWGVVASSQANVIYDFDISFTDGPLAGDSFSGNFVLDRVPPSDLFTLFFTPGGPPGLQLVSFDITIAGVAFTAANDTIYPAGPRAVFYGGDFIYLEASLRILDSGQLFIGQGGQASFQPLPVGDASRGSISNVLARVPEPTTLALFGLAGIGAMRRRKLAA